MGARIVILILLLSPFGVYADSRLDDYPGLELVDKVIGKADAVSYTHLTLPTKRIV